MNEAPSGGLQDSECLIALDHEVEQIRDQSDLPFWDQDWIPDTLRDLLFAQPAADQVLRTYFLVDASLRSAKLGGFDLDTLDVPVKCLFQGVAAGELDVVAPYLIDMTLPYGVDTKWGDVPTFHKEFFKSHWAENTGFFVRTTAQLSALRAHFRKFTRIQIEEDRRWIFFRFWDPRMAPSYFDSIKADKAKIAQWFQMRDAQRIESIIGNHIDSMNAWQVTPQWSVLTDCELTATPLLSSKEMKGLERYRHYRYERRALAFVRQSFPQIVQTLSDDQAIVFIQSAYERASARLITTERDHFKYLTAAVLLGIAFETDPQFAPMIAMTRFDDHRYPNFESLFAEIDRADAVLQRDFGSPKRVLLGFERLYSSPSAELNYQTVEAKIRNIWPNYAARLSSEDWHRFIGHAGSLGHNIGLKGSDLVMYICLAVCFGAEFVNDPMYPWAKETLSIPDEDTRRHAFGAAVLNHFQIMMETSLE